MSLRLVVVLFLPHQLVGLCPHCRSCDQDCTCFSIALNHLKSYNDIYTDWSLYHKICSKNKCPDQQHKKIKIKIKKKRNTLIRTHRHPKLLLYMPACIHQHVDTQTYTQTPYGVCVKSLWDTLYIDTHTICLDPTYTNGERLYFQTVKTGIHVKRNLSLPSPRILFYLRKTSFSASRQLLYTPFIRPSVRGRLERRGGGEEEKLPISCSFPTQSPPAPSRSVPHPPTPLSL